jgi:hypothetical protein
VHSVCGDVGFLFEVVLGELLKLLCVVGLELAEFVAGSSLALGLRALFLELCFFGDVATFHLHAAPVGVSCELVLLPAEAAEGVCGIAFDPADTAGRGLAAVVPGYVDLASR